MLVVHFTFRRSRALLSSMQAIAGHCCSCYNGPDSRSNLVVLRSHDGGARAGASEDAEDAACRLKPIPAISTWCRAYMRQGGRTSRSPSSGRSRMGASLLQTVSRGAADRYCDRFVRVQPQCGTASRDQDGYVKAGARMSHALAAPVARIW